MDKPFDAERLLGPATTWIAFVGAIGIMLVATAILIDVLMRWLFNAPILGVDDLSKYILAVVISSFFPLGLAKGHFVTIRFLGRALGLKSTLWLELVGAVGTLVFFVLLAWQMLRFSAQATQTGLATVVLEFPVAPWWWFVTAILFACIAVQAVILADGILRVLEGRPPAHGAGGAPAVDTGG